MRDFRADGELSDVLCRSQHDTDPNQVVHDGRGSGVIGAARAHVIDQRRGSEAQRVQLAERVALQAPEMALLTALPRGDRLERVDIPAGQLADGHRRMLFAGECCRVLELDFPVLRPGHRRGAMRKGLGFPMGDRLVHTLAHDRGAADRAIRLPACLDRCHDGIGADKPILSPLCLLRKR